MLLQRLEDGLIHVLVPHILNHNIPNMSGLGVLIAGTGVQGVQFAVSFLNRLGHGVQRLGIELETALFQHGAQPCLIRGVVDNIIIHIGVARLELPLVQIPVVAVDVLQVRIQTVQFHADALALGQEFVGPCPQFLRGVIHKDHIFRHLNQMPAHDNRVVRDAYAFGIFIECLLQFRSDLGDGAAAVTDGNGVAVAGCPKVGFAPQIGVFFRVNGFPVG